MYSLPSLPPRRRSSFLSHCILFMARPGLTAVDTYTPYERYEMREPRRKCTSIYLFRFHESNLSDPSAIPNTMPGILISDFAPCPIHRARQEQAREVDRPTRGWRSRTPGRLATLVNVVLIQSGFLPSTVVPVGLVNVAFFFCTNQEGHHLIREW